MGDIKHVENKDYFYLLGHCRWVKGSCFGAIYDLFREKLFWVKQKNLANGLEYALAGIRLSDASSKVGLDKEVLVEFCRILALMGYGRLNDMPQVTENFKPYLTKKKIKELEVNQPISRATFQITDKCSYKCSFCGFKEGISTSLCSCGCWPSSDEYAKDVFTNTLDSLINLNCNRLDIQGGEPFLEPKRLWPIVEKARKEGMPVFIHTTAYNLDNVSLEKISKLGVNLVIPVFSTCRNVFDSISGQQGSFDSFIKVLDYFKNSKKTSIIAKVIILEQTMQSLQELKTWLLDRGIKEIIIEYYKPLQGNNTNCLQSAFPEMLIRSDEKFKPNLYEFERLKEGHSCFPGNLTITMNGRLVPCIAAANYTIADLKQISILDAMHQDLMEPYWEKGVNSRKECKQCEFKYACKECSVQTERFSNESERHWNCLYMPMVGEWIV